MKNKNYLLWLWRIFYPLILYSIITFVVQISFGVVFALSLNKEALDTESTLNLLTEKLNSTSLYMLFVSAMITLPILLLLMKKDRKKKEELTGVIAYKKPTTTEYLLMAILGFSLCLGINKLIEISHIIDIFPGFTEVATAIYGGNIILELLIIAILAPIIEEMLFRGISHNRIKEYLSPKTSIILSSLIFGIYHMNMVQMIYATLLGLALAYVYEKFHTLMAPIVLHCSANILSVLSVEVDTIEVLFENTVVSVLTLIITLTVTIIIMLKFHKTTQSYTS